MKQMELTGIGHSEYVPRMPGSVNFTSEATTRAADRLAHLLRIGEDQFAIDSGNALVPAVGDPVQVTFSATVMVALRSPRGPSSSSLR